MGELKKGTERRNREMERTWVNESERIESSEVQKRQLNKREGEGKKREFQGGDYKGTVIGMGLGEDGYRWGGGPGQGRILGYIN